MNNTARIHTAPAIGLVVLGCDKNTADAERLAGMLSGRLPARTAIHGLAPDADNIPRLDAVVIYTCAFIHDAKEESVETILAWCARKTETGNPRRVYVAGCLSQRHGEALTEEIPEVDGFFGVSDITTLVETLCDAPRPTEMDIAAPVRRRLDDKPHAFLKIADGCNHACAFCVIPHIKGPFHSTPRETLLADARELVKQGARELTLVAQDTTAYGRDLYPDYRLPELLRDLCALPGDFWVRCLYCYPGGVTDALIEQMATQPKIAPYLDMPLQHVSPSVLHAMKRPAPEQDIVALVARLRAALPNLALRTTMLVGFPGESGADHRMMLDAVREIAFEWLGAFIFCPEEGAPAATMAAPVPEAIARKRFEALMELQAEITARFNKSREGQQTRALVENYDPDLNAWTARSVAEAPDVDGAVLIYPHPSLKQGAFADVEFINASLYDITARVVE